ncbi:hypothetical protein ACXR2U_01850 [Jatrophihabitans sp. YIM 134969]
MTPEQLLDLVDGLPWGRALERSDMPEDAVLTDALAVLAGHPRLPAIASMLCAHASTDHVEPAVLTALCQTVLATDSPSVFADALDALVASAATLTFNGSLLASQLLAQGGPPAADADAWQIQRAADALAVATRLRLGGFSVRYDLLSVLSGIAGPAPTPWSRSAARSVLACIEAWPESVDLLVCLERLAGIAAPLPSHTGPSKPADEQESDFASAIARVEILRALRSQARDQAVEHLDRARRLLAPALAHDDRSDSEVLDAIAALITDLLLTASITDTVLIDRIHVAVAEHAWLDPGVNHWVGSRVAAGHVAWAKLATALEYARERLAEPSWLHAAAVLENIVDLYRTTRSMRAFRRSEDSAAVLDVVAPMIESGFAARAALLHHLAAYTAELDKLADTGVASEQQLADLPIARNLLDVVAERTRAGDADPKRSAGVDADSPLSDSPADKAVAGVVREAMARASLARQTTGSLVVDAVLEIIHDGLAGSADYRDMPDVAPAVDLVSSLLVSFLYARERATSSMRSYLFNQDASEEDLARDVQDYLVGCGQLGSVRTEVRRVGGGRVDIEFAFAGFNLYVELKADSTAVPLADKFAYQRQSAAYQSTDPRVGFLLVLKILKPKSVPGHLSENVEVVEVTDDAGGIRHVVALALSGGRTSPSSM